MKNIFFIDGPQMSGKSTLIEFLEKTTKGLVYKFDFSEFFKNFNLDKSKDIWGFQIGKDFAILSLLEKINSNQKIFIDRGPFSSIYYSLLFNRQKEEIVLKYFDYLKKYKFSYIFILPLNRKKMKRVKKDGFDGLDEDYNKEIIEKINKISKDKEIKFKVFYNDFSKSIEENGKKLKEIIEDEHFGNTN